MSNHALQLSGRPPGQKHREKKCSQADQGQNANKPQKEQLLGHKHVIIGHHGSHGDDIPGDANRIECLPGV